MFSNESLNNLISNVIIELERDEEEYLNMINIPNQFDEIDKRVNIPEETLEIALKFVARLFALYHMKRKSIFYLNDRKF